MADPPPTADTEPFGRVPYGQVNAGLVANMTHADVRVYLIICAHAGADWTAWPSLTRIAELAGIKRPVVCRAVKRLESIGAITAERSVGRGHLTRYRVVVNGHPGVTNSEQTNGHPEVTNPDRKWSLQSTEMVTLEAVNGHPRVTRTDRTEEGTNERACGPVLGTSYIGGNGAYREFERRSRNRR